MMIRPQDNPFRVDRLHALPFEPQGMTWPALIRRTNDLRFRAAVVGPHGSGKTTLLHALVEPIRCAGRRPRMLFRNQAGGWAMPAGWRNTLDSLSADDVLLVDGYGHLGPLQRRQMRRATARTGAGLIVAAHHRTALPTLIRTRTDPTLLGRLIEQLLGAPLPAATVAQLHRRHRGNLREALRELYDEASQGMHE